MGRHHFCNGKKYRQKLLYQFPAEMTDKKVAILEIEDEYKYMNKELIEIIKLSIEPYL